MVVIVSWLIWLSTEDLSIRWVLLFAATICVLFVMRLLKSLSDRGVVNPKENAQNEDQNYSERFLFYPLVGFLTGLAVTPVAIFLMALKSGLHGHIAPEFTSAQVFTVLQRTPIWVIGGLMVGVGVGMLRWSRINQ